MRQYAQNIKSDISEKEIKKKLWSESLKSHQEIQTFILEVQIHEKNNTNTSNRR